MLGKIKTTFSGINLRLASLILLVIYTLGLSYYKLTHITPQLNRETVENLMVSSGQDIFNNSLYLPHKVFQYLIFKLDVGSITSLRSISIVIGLAGVISMYLLLSKWHTNRVALASSLLLASMSIYLHSTRTATAEVIYISILPILILLGTWLKSKKDITKLPVASLIVAVSLYIPGAWLYVIAGVISLRKRIIKSLQLNSSFVSASAVLFFMVSTTPLIISFYKSPKLIIEWLGLPVDSGLDVLSLVKNITSVPVDLVFNGPESQASWLVGTPVLDVFIVAVVVLGIYSYQVGNHPVRRNVLIGYSMISLFLVALGGPVSLHVFVPIAIIYAANGISLLLQQWFTVFPKNPFARSLGLLLISAGVMFSCYYNVKRYFIVWPQNPDTVQAIQAEKAKF